MAGIIKKSMAVTCAGFVLIVSMVQIASGGAAMTGAQKKEAVYRMYADYKKDFPAVEDISVREAMQMLQQGAVVFVDTRKPAEMAVSMLPTAISQEDFLNHLERYEHKTAVGYCTISYRSGIFARKMAEQGITVVNLRGGILAWLLEGGKVYDPNGNEVRRVHVYGDKWDYAPAGFDTVKFGLLEQLF